MKIHNDDNYKKWNLSLSVTLSTIIIQDSYKTFKCKKKDKNILLKENIIKNSSFFP